jgi:hypothetical protein
MEITVKITSSKSLGRYTYKCKIYIDEDCIVTVGSKKKAVDVAWNLARKLNCGEPKFYQ